MAKRQSELLAEEMEVLRAEVELIAKMTVPDEDAAERAEYDAAQERSDVLRAEWQTKKALYDKARDREKQVDEIMRAHQEEANRETGAPRRGPEVKRTRDAFEADAEFASLMRSALTGPEVVNFDPESTIDRAHYAVDQVPRYVGDDVKERLHSLLADEESSQTALIARHILLTGSPEYRAEFKAHVQSMGRHFPELIRTAMSLTAGNGGVLVPHYLDPTIILTNAGVYGGTIRALATVQTIGTNVWEGVSSAGVSAAWVAEGAPATDGTPTFSAPTITTHLAAAWLTGSYQVLADSGFSGQLPRLLTDAKVRLEEADFGTANTGATKPRGVVAAVAAVTASIVTSATTGAFVVGDVHNTSNAVNPRQEQNLAWLAHKASARSSTRTRPSATA